MKNDMKMQYNTRSTSDAIRHFESLQSKRPPSSAMSYSRPPIPVPASRTASLDDNDDYDDGDHRAYKNNSRYSKNYNDHESDADSRDDDDKHENETEAEDNTIVTNTSLITSNVMTIAVFGAYGKLGKEFVRVALDAGYRLQAMTLISTDTKSKSSRQSSAHEVKKTHGVEYSVHPSPAARSVSSQMPSQMEQVEAESWDDVEAIKRTVKGAQYVVCLLNEKNAMVADKTIIPSLAANKPHNDETLYRFVRLLFPCVRLVPTVQVLLWQAHSMSPDVHGETPLFGSVVRNVMIRKRTKMRLHDKVISYIAQQYSMNDVVPGSHSVGTLDASKSTTDSGKAETDKRGSTSSAKTAGSRPSQDKNKSGRQSGTSHYSSTSNRSIKSDKKQITDDSGRETAKDKPKTPQFAFLITRPSLWMIDGPSARRLSASKSVSRTCQRDCDECS
jgi:NmrA-like family